MPNITFDSPFLKLLWNVVQQVGILEGGGNKNVKNGQTELIVWFFNVPQTAFSLQVAEQSTQFYYDFFLQIYTKQVLLKEKMLLFPQTLAPQRTNPSSFALFLSLHKPSKYK